jgi:hypothetical protein
MHTNIESEERRLATRWTFIEMYSVVYYVYNTCSSIIINFAILMPTLKLCECHLLQHENDARVRCVSKGFAKTTCHVGHTGTRFITKVKQLLGPDITWMNDHPNDKYAGCCYKVYLNLVAWGAIHQFSRIILNSDSKRDS